ncbi:major capsid protein [Pseudomonas aeruginosa]|nr:major capsid protein [Pseudomonas aeruginosa]
MSSLVVQIERTAPRCNWWRAKGPRRRRPGRTSDSVNWSPFNTVHLPQTFQIVADEIQGHPCGGCRTELQSAEAVVAKRLEEARRHWT